MSNFQGRFFVFFQKFSKKNDEQIFTSLSFKISPILYPNYRDPEPHNLTEVWTQLKKRRQPVSKWIPTG